MYYVLSRINLIRKQSGKQFLLLADPFISKSGFRQLIYYDNLIIQTLFNIQNPTEIPSSSGSGNESDDDHDDDTIEENSGEETEEPTTVMVCIELIDEVEMSNLMQINN